MERPIEWRALSPFVSGTLTRPSEQVSARPRPLVTLFPLISPHLAHAAGSCAAARARRLRRRMHQNKFTRGVHQLPKQCGAVRCREPLELTRARVRHLRRPAFEPVAWPLFFGVDQRLRRGHPAAQRVDEGAVLVAAARRAARIHSSRIMAAAGAYAPHECHAVLSPVALRLRRNARQPGDSGAPRISSRQ